MGGGDRLKASRAGNGGVGSASNGSKTAPTSNLVVLPELPLPQSLHKGTVTSPLSNKTNPPSQNWSHHSSTVAVSQGSCFCEWSRDPLFLFAYLRTQR